MTGSGLQHLLSYFQPQVTGLAGGLPTLGQVESCSGGRYSGSFSHGHMDRELGGRRLVEVRRLSKTPTSGQVFPFISEARVWRRHAELTHRESPLLSLTLQHRSKVGSSPGCFHKTIQTLPDRKIESKYTSSTSTHACVPFLKKGKQRRLASISPSHASFVSRVKFNLSSHFAKESLEARPSGQEDAAAQANKVCDVAEPDPDLVPGKGISKVSC